jgi:hypothetical protein
MNREDEMFTDVSLKGFEEWCYAVCDHYFHKPPFKGSAHLCDSSDDYYGWTEFDFTIYDENHNDMTEVVNALSKADYYELYRDLLSEYEMYLENKYVGDF